MWNVICLKAADWFQIKRSLLAHVLCRMQWVCVVGELDVFAIRSFSASAFRHDASMLLQFCMCFSFHLRWLECNSACGVATRDAREQRIQNSRFECVLIRLLCCDHCACAYVLCHNIFTMKRHRGCASSSKCISTPTMKLTMYTSHTHDTHPNAMTWNRNQSLALHCTNANAAAFSHLRVPSRWMISNTTRTTFEWTPLVNTYT